MGFSYAKFKQVGRAILDCLKCKVKNLVDQKLFANLFAALIKHPESQFGTGFAYFSPGKKFF